MKAYFEFVELRHKVEIHQMMGRVAECPIDEMNRLRGRRVARLRIPPTAGQMGQRAVTVERVRVPRVELIYSEQGAGEP